jgi:hypothetical protein
MDAGDADPSYRGAELFAYVAGWAGTNLDRVKQASHNNDA